MLARDMSSAETEIEDVNRHIAEQMGRLARQQVLIEKLKASGRDVTEAARFLEAIEEMLWQMIDRRKLLLSRPVKPK
jgi:hypothetical protein